MVPERVQPSEGSSYRARRTPADGHIDFRPSAETIERLVRAVSHPYPGAYSYYGGTKVVFWRASLQGIPNHVGTPGQILLSKDGRLLVQAGDRPLWLFDAMVESGRKARPCSGWGTSSGTPSRTNCIGCRTSCPVCRWNGTRGGRPGRPHEHEERFGGGRSSG
ncbi:MAG: hypothetical protein Ct9H300mP1_26720 [Planctomycetaceae bacterium]|nr:MAG: hypothetical protein Ct9H300mP1_26720 [Planctomycetaceae bacterium]